LTGFADRLGKFGHVYTMLFVVFGWVVFRAENLTCAARYFQNMFGVGVSGIYDNATAYWLHEYRWQFLFALLFSTPVAKIISRRLSEYKYAIPAYQVLVSFLIIFTITAMLVSSYNPFIYFNF
jgi:hypothetical protein